MLTCSEFEYYNENTLMINLKGIILPDHYQNFITNKKQNQNQVEHLVDEIDNSAKSIKELSGKYNVALSTLWGIEKQREHYLIGVCRRKYC